MTNLGPTNDNINIDGSIATYTDFGGTDTYTILPNLGGDVVITDVQASIINLPENLDVTAARFLADGVEFTVNGFTVTFIGAPQQATFVFGGTPLDPNAGSELSFEGTASAFGTSIPALGEDANSASQTGPVNPDGSVGDGGFSLPEDPGLTSPDGIFFQDVSFQTETGDNDTTAQGLLSLDITDNASGFSSSDAVNFIVRNAQLTVGDSLGITRSPDSTFSFSGAATNVLLPGTDDGSARLRIASTDGSSTEGIIFISDGAKVTLDTPDQDKNGSVQIGVNFGSFGDDVAGQAVKGTLVVEGMGSSLSVLNSAGGARGNFNIGSVFLSDQGQDDVTSDRTADGLVVVRDGAQINVQSFVGVGETSNIVGASSSGVLVVEGADTRVAINPDGTASGGSMNIGDGEGAKGQLILRDGAELSLLAGFEFGGGMSLAGAGSRPGGEGEAAISGSGTRLFVEQGSIQVGRNEGTANFAVSDGASVETLFFTSGRSGVGHTTFEGEGTQLFLSGSQLVPEFGAFLTVGREGHGTFMLRDGADVSIIGAGDDSQFPGFQIGRNDGAVGEMTVMGAGSTITIDGSAVTDAGNGETGFIRIGNEAGSDGTLNVLDGGVITNDANGVFYVSQNEGSNGVLTIDGMGSAVNFGAAAFFSQDASGTRGNAIVTVSDGARLEGGEITNNGILDVTSGGQLHADLIQDNILRSSSGIEDLAINGDLTVNTGGFAFDFLVDDGGVLSHDTYTATGDINLEGILYVLTASPTDLEGLTADILTGSSITVSENFAVQLIEFDANALTDVNSDALLSAAGNAMDLSFTVSATALTVDFTGVSDVTPAAQTLGITDGGDTGLMF